MTSVVIMEADYTKGIFIHMQWLIVVCRIGNTEVIYHSKLP